MDPNRLRAVLNLVRAIVALLAAFGVTSFVAGNPGGLSTDTATQTVSTQTIAKAPAAPAGDLTQAAPADADAAQGVPPAQSPLRDETPPGIPEKTLEAGQQAGDQAAAGAQVTDSALPVAGAQNYSVRQDFKGHVYGDFSPGVTPSMFCVHYTVSSNVAGWGDVTGTQGYFIRTRVGSATYIGDFEAHFLQMTPLSNKAWTQGPFNPFCRASIEIIATGRETRAQWLASPLIKQGKLASLMRDVMTKYHIPLRFVDPKGCTPIPGWTDHNHIECGNDHFDVSPTCAFSNANNGKPLYPAYSPPGCTGFPFDVVQRQLADSPQPDVHWLTKWERGRVLVLQRERRIAKRHHGWQHIASSHLKRAVRAKHQLQHRRRYLKHAKGGLGKYHRKARLHALWRIINQR